MMQKWWRRAGGHVRANARALRLGDRRKGFTTYLLRVRREEGKTDSRKLATRSVSSRPGKKNIHERAEINEPSSVCSPFHSL